MTRFYRLAFALAVVVAAANPRAAAAASLLIDSNGILIGATGVQVGGNSYDVSFVDGSCVTLFSGCERQATSISSSRLMPSPPPRRSWTRCSACNSTSILI